MQPPKSPISRAVWQSPLNRVEYVEYHRKVCYINIHYYYYYYYHCQLSGSSRTSLHSTAIDALFIVFFYFFFIQLKEIFEF